MRMKSLDV